MIFRAFDNREINSEIDNKIEESIEAEVETVLISKVFISSFNNLILIFEEIVEVAFVVHQSISTEKKKELNLKK